MSRTVKSEAEAKVTFYSTMIAEGFIAMVWAAGAMVIFSTGRAPLDTAGTLMVGEISKYFMGDIGGLLAVLGVIALPITSGDTAFRSLRLIISEELNIDQRSGAKEQALQQFYLYLQQQSSSLQSQTQMDLTCFGDTLDSQTNS